jgi:hypothetical protein
MSKVYLGSCAQLYSVADTPQPPIPPHFGSCIRGRYWSAKIDDISMTPWNIVNRGTGFPFARMIWVPQPPFPCEMVPPLCLSTPCMNSSSICG